MRKTATFILLTILVAAFGCVPKNRTAVVAPPVEAYKPMDFSDRELPVPSTPQRHQSSLWFTDNNRNWLFTDHKARTVNDVVTIRVMEESLAKKKAETKTGKGSTIGAGISGLFGLERKLAKSNPDMNLETLVGAKFDNQFNGKGETTRSGKLVATISATVIDVLPNGNLLVEGKRVVTVNNEEEIMTITGIVRPRDITADNSIASTQVADAKIEYLGRGVLADKQKPGWFSRGMDKAWPF